MATQDDREFYEWLRDELDNHDMRQQDLADAIDVDQGTVSDWVNGHTKPQPGNCRAIARLWGLDPNEVLLRAGRRGIPPHARISEASRPYVASGVPAAGTQEALDEIREEQRRQREILETLLKRIEDRQS